MRIPRLYLPTALVPDAIVALSADAAHHVARVLRLEVGATVCLFNGEGGGHEAVLHSINKNQVCARVLSYSPRDAESPLQVTLAQCIPRGERMDYTLQKVVELGVTRIAPLFSERCEVRLQGERLDKRLHHWQGIIISACEQCGRTRIPPLAAPMSLQHWLSASNFSGDGLHLVLDPLGADSLAHCTKPVDNNITLLIGPEGGLNDAEITAAEDAGFMRIRAGPRILRTETAGPAVLAALQALWGDLR
jgi:16S rRNA (uracil1498-N3)-methyltransferase